MRLIILLLVLVAMGTGCKRTWTEKDKSEFRAGCMKGAVADMGKDSAIRYCDCMLKQVVARHPNAHDAGYIRYDTAMRRLAEECLKQP